MSLENDSPLLSLMLDDDRVTRVCAAFQLFLALDTRARALRLMVNGMIPKYAGTDAERDLLAVREAADWLAAQIGPYAVATSAEIQQPADEAKPHPHLH